MNTTLLGVTVQLNHKPNVSEDLVALAEYETLVKVVRLASPKNVEEFARALY